MRPEPKSHRWIWYLLLVVLVDLALTTPFVFRDAVEGDTLRYALGLDRWLAGRSAFSALFNVEMSFGYYLGLAGYETLSPVPLRQLPGVLNQVSWFFGLVASGTLYLWWRRWWGDGVAVRLTLLFLLTPAFWSLHLYGNTNIVGLALAAGCLALLPAKGDRSGIGWVRTLLAVALGLSALTVRTDLLMLAPAVVAFLLWGKDRLRACPMAATLLAAFAGYLLLRGAVLGLPVGGGSVAHHFRTNVSLGDPRWLLHTVFENLAAVASSGPPLVLLASAIAFLALRRPSGNSVRWTVLLWILPGIAFLAFGRVHVSRILLPLFPALLLPLAVWAAERGGRRDLCLAGLALVAHLGMALVPGLENRTSDRDPSTRRVSHYLFRDLMFRQHGVIGRNAAATLADADALLARGADDERAFVVIGGDVLFYEFALEADHPGTTVETIGRGYQLLLRRAEVPERSHPWYFLEPRWGRDPEPELLRFGVGPEVERHWIPLSLRLQGRAP